MMECRKSDNWVSVSGYNDESMEMVWEDLCVEVLHMEDYLWAFQNEHLLYLPKHG